MEPRRTMLLNSVHWWTSPPSDTCDGPKKPSSWPSDLTSIAGSQTILTDSQIPIVRCFLALHFHPVPPCQTDLSREEILPGFVRCSLTLDSCPHSPRQTVLSCEVKLPGFIQCSHALQSRPILPRQTVLSREVTLPGFVRCSLALHSCPDSPRQTVLSREVILLGFIRCPSLCLPGRTFGLF